MRYFEYLLKTHYETVKAFSHKTGLNEGAIYTYMEGRRFPSVPSFMLCAEAFGITAEDLWNNWYKEYSLNGKK